MDPGGGPRAPVPPASHHLPELRPSPTVILSAAKDLGGGPRTPVPPASHHPPALQPPHCHPERSEVGARLTRATSACGARFASLTRYGSEARMRCAPTDHVSFRAAPSREESPDGMSDASTRPTAPSFETTISPAPNPRASHRPPEAPPLQYPLQSAPADCTLSRILYERIPKNPLRTTHPPNTKLPSASAKQLPSSIHCNPPCGLHAQRIACAADCMLRGLH
jgi:hypothetical protein